MVVCIGCLQSFSLHGYSQHVRRTGNAACHHAYHEAEVAAELEADVPEDFFGPYDENDLQWEPDSAEANGNGSDGNATGNHHCGDNDIDDDDIDESSSSDSNHCNDDTDKSGSSGDDGDYPSSDKDVG